MSLAGLRQQTKKPEIWYERMLSAPVGPRSRLAFADGLRGLAALWVVLFHLSEGRHIELIRAAIPRVLYNVIFDFGHLGVAIFFVLSGFVMALTVQQARVNTKYAAKFILRRLIRLAPPYYFAIAITLLFEILRAKTLHTEFKMVSLQDLLAHIVFLQDIISIPQINLVYWTLCIEVQFYIAFAILMWIASWAAEAFANIRQVRVIVVMVSCAMALIWAFQVTINPLWTGGFIGFWYSFLAGVLVSTVSAENTMLRKVVFAYFLVLALASAITHSLFTFAVVVTSLLMTVAAIRKKMHVWLNLTWIQSLGLISYSLYLLHNPIAGASFGVLGRICPDGLLYEVFEAVFVVAACVIVSWIAYLVVERPSIAWSHLIVLREANSGRTNETTP